MPEPCSHFGITTGYVTDPGGTVDGPHDLCVVTTARCCRRGRTQPDRSSEDFHQIKRTFEGGTACPLALDEASLAILHFNQRELAKAVVRSTMIASLHTNPAEHYLQILTGPEIPLHFEEDVGFPKLIDINDLENVLTDLDTTPISVSEWEVFDAGVSTGKIATMVAFEYPRTDLQPPTTSVPFSVVGHSRQPHDGRPRTDLEDGEGDWLKLFFSLQGSLRLRFPGISHEQFERFRARGRNRGE